MKHPSIKKLFKFLAFSLIISLISTSLVFGENAEPTFDGLYGPIFSDLTLSQDGGDYSGSLDVEGTANIDGTTDLNSTLTVDGATDLNSTLNVDGDTSLNATLNLGGDINDPNNDGITVSTDLSLENILYVLDSLINSDSNEPILVDDDLKVTGDLIIDENIESSTGDTILINDNLSVNGDISTENNLNAAAITATDAIDAQDYIHNSQLDTVTITDDLYVSGEITAEAIGNFYRIQSDLNMVDPNSASQETLDCENGGSVISCHIEPCFSPYLIKQEGELDESLFTTMAKNNLTIFMKYVEENIGDTREDSEESKSEAEDNICVSDDNGDLNQDAICNILDVVSLVNVIFNGSEIDNDDLNSDNNTDVSDLVILVDNILEGTCNYSYTCDDGIENSISLTISSLADTSFDLEYDTSVEIGAFQFKIDGPALENVSNGEAENHNFSINYDYNNGVNTVVVYNLTGGTIDSLSGILNTLEFTDSIGRDICIYLPKFVDNDGRNITPTSNGAICGDSKTTATLSFDKASYSIDNTSIITLTDYESDTDDEIKNIVNLNIFSDSDSSGITITAIETGPATGVFIASVNLVSFESGSSNLRVSSGDTVTAEYQTIQATATIDGEDLNLEDIDLSTIEDTSLGKFIIFLLNLNDEINNHNPCIALDSENHFFDYIASKVTYITSLNEDVFMYFELGKLALQVLEFYELSSSSYDSRWLMNYHAMHAFPDQYRTSCMGGTFNSSSFLEIGYYLDAVCFDPSASGINYQASQLLDTTMDILN